MALGKPIITTALPECRKYKSVIIAHNKEEFSENLNNVKNLYNAEMIEVEKREAIQNSWKYKGEEILNLMQIYEGGKLGDN